MIDLLERCLRIPSLSGREREVAAFLRDEMAARGFDRAFIDDAGNAVGVIGNGLRQIVLLGHMDTVGGDVLVRIEDGKLYGRGSVDAKGPLCAFILAAQAARQVVVDSPWSIVVVGAVEEEAATSKGARFAATQYRPELCVIGEPSGVDGITLGYKGRLLAHARYERAAQHTAVPGPTVSEQAVALWNQARAFADAYNADKPKAFDQVMPSLRRIQSGEDGLREWCEVLIAARLPLEVGPDAMAGHLRAWADATPADLAALTFSGHERTYRTAKDTSLARAFVDAIRAHKLRPAFKHKTGTADFNVVGPIWECPMVAYGPGDSTLDHTPHEHVHIDEFEKAVKVLTIVLKALTGP